MDASRPRPSRRTVMQGLIMGAVAATTTTTPMESSEAPEGATGPAPWWLMAPLAVGSSLVGGWTLADLSDVRRGAAVVTLSHPRHGDMDVHLCRHDGHPCGVASTYGIDLLVMDGGRGDRPTDEGLGLSVMRLADQIRSNELADGAHLQPEVRLMPHPRRMALYGPVRLPHG